MPSPTPNPLELLKDPYLYVIGLFAWLSVDLLGKPEKSITWFIGVALLILSVVLLVIRFTVSLYRDYIENFFRTNYQTLLDEKSRQVIELTELVSTKTTTETIGQKVIQRGLDKTLAGTSYEVETADPETEES